MTNNRWWEYQPTQEKNQRLADSWQRQARAYVYGQQTKSLLPGPGNNYNLLDTGILHPSDLNSIVPEPPKTHRQGIISRVGNALDDASSTVFGGKVRQPWDLLRPVQRGLEAEQKYVVRPLAKAVLSPLPGSYEDLPQWLRTGTELVVDPLNYLPLGALAKAGRLAPELVTGTRALSELAPAMGSRRLLANYILKNAGVSLGAGAGAYAAEKLGLPSPIGAFVGGELAHRGLTRPPSDTLDLGGGIAYKSRDTYRPQGQQIFVPQDTDIYHGTTTPYEGLPRPVPEDSRKYNTSHPDAVYFSISPQLASDFAGSIPGSRVVPAVLKRGTRVWDPNRDEWPAGVLTPEADSEIRQSWQQTQREMQVHPGMETPFLDFVNYGATRQGMLDFVDDLKKRGYQGVLSGRELAVWDMNAIEPKYLGRMRQFDSKIAQFRRTGNFSAIVDPSSPEMQRILKAEEEALQELTPRQLAQANRAGVQAMKDQEFYTGLIKKINETGYEPTRADKRRIQRMQKRHPGATGTVGAAEALPQDTVNILTRLNDMAYSNDMAPIGAINRWEVTQHAALNRSASQWLRGKMAGILPPETVQSLDRMGLRLQDDPQFTPVFNNYGDIAKTGFNTGAAEADLMHARLSRAFKLQDINDVGTIVDDPKLLGRALQIESSPGPVRLGNGRMAPKPDFALTHNGQLRLADVAAHPEFFTSELSTRQLGALAYVQAVLDRHRNLEAAFGIKPETGKGFHSEPLNTPVDVALMGATGANITQSTPIAESLREQRARQWAPAVRKAFGARQTFEEPRQFLSEAEGAKAGIKYLPFVDAQRARISQGYKRIADKYLEAELSGISKRPKELLPEELEVQRQQLLPQRRQLQDLDRELTRALSAHQRGAWVEPSWKPSSQEIADHVARARDAVNTPQMRNRLADLRTARDAVRLSLANVDNAYKPLLAQRQDLLRRLTAGQTVTDLSRFYPEQYRGRFYPLLTRGGLGPDQLTKLSAGERAVSNAPVYNIANQLRALEPRGQANGALSAIDWFNDRTRGILATLDASFLGVQGLLPAFTNPAVFADTLYNLVAGHYDEAVDQLARKGVVDEFIQAGGHYAARHDFGELLFNRGIEKVPAVGQLAAGSNRAFTNFGNLMRLKLYEAARRPGMDQSSRESLARTINLSTGFNPGDPSSIERTLLFAPRFFRAQLGLLSDAITRNGIVRRDQQGKITFHGISRNGALGKLATFVGLGTTATYAINQALGQETDFDPSSPNFMRIRYGGKDISLFGTWDTLLKLASTAINDGPDTAAYNALRYKASPAMARILDLIEGSTLGGTELDASSPQALALSAAKLAGTTAVPISIQSLVNEGDLSNPQAAATSLATSFLGVKASPMSKVEVMLSQREAAARHQYNKSWYDLEPYQQSQIYKDHPEFDLGTDSELSIAYDYRTQIAKRFQDQFQRLDDQLPIGPQWIDAYQELKRQQAGAYEEWAQENPVAANKERTHKSTNPQELKRQQYLDLFDQASKENWSKDELSQALANFEAQLSPADQAYIDRNLGLHDTPRIKAYKQAQGVLRPYWEIQDQVYDKYKNRSALAAQYSTLQDYVNAETMRMQQAGIPDGVIVRRLNNLPLVRQVDQHTKTLRDRLRRQNPDIDAALTLWYGYTPIRYRQG